ncbi:hypothetical protein N7931_13085 [Catenovulum sp. 2E275]|uniref:sugar phosphate isomerase/epimerase family protein n=1 Tax=Catenovulum sp. 2E275 TaxID=2980497 RepID=UPI0021D21718|nr:hypothetical protein [Catenovulum sp. 2E275]MCU4676565.1 hypothetical protein [Catenovulum sp. 2E275]
MFNRRQFLQYSLGSSALIGSQLSPALGLNSALATTQKPLELNIFATNWGYKGSFDEFCNQTKQAGYDGVELWLPSPDKTRAVVNTLEKYDLKMLLLVGAHQGDFNEHFAIFKNDLKRAIALNPVKINCHTGRDYFTFEQASVFFNESSAQTKAANIQICHETHRARILFAAHICQSYLQAFPDLRLTLDISHWVNVASSLLDDQKAAVKLALERTDHIHSRVGFTHGPQVNDPRAPEWQKTFAAHVAWWDTVVDIKRQSTGKLSMTPEFGPFPYMPTLPYTKQAVGNQWEINQYMLEFWRNRYG